MPENSAATVNHGSAPPPMSSPATKPPKPPRRLWPWVLILLLAGGFAAYTWFTLWYSYSDGERVGILQKFSRKGWVCKTHEGELALYAVAGISPQIWAFSVREKSVATRLNAALGQRVRLHYEEHRGVPTQCFGDTTYFVDDVRQVAQP